MAKVRKKCEYCNSTFEVFPAAAKRRRTCSRECGYAIQRAEKNKKKPCVGCGKVTTNPKYCSSKCQGKTVREQSYIKNKRLFEQGELTSRKNIRVFLEERDGKACCSCKRAEWMGKPITLWVDHISGNAADNSPNNLRLICPNCDSQSETFGGRNRGNGRVSQGLKPWE